MAIYRCNACGYVSEETATAVGQKVACGRCGQASTVYGTVFFIEKLIERYAAAMRELQALRAADDGATADEAARERRVAVAVVVHNQDHAVGNGRSDARIGQRPAGFRDQDRDSSQ